MNNTFEQIRQAMSPKLAAKAAAIANTQELHDLNKKLSQRLDKIESFLSDIEDEVFSDNIVKRW